MSADEIVTVFCETLSGGGLQESLQYIAPNCVYQNMPFDPVTGPEGVEQVLAGFFRDHRAGHDQNARTGRGR